MPRESHPLMGHGLAAPVNTLSYAYYKSDSIVLVLFLYTKRSLQKVSKIPLPHLARLQGLERLKTGHATAGFVPIARHEFESVGLTLLTFLVCNL